METNQNPLEVLTTKFQETVAETQNLANQITTKVEETATVVTAWVQSAPSSIVSAGAIATQEAFKIAHNIRFENLPTNLQFKSKTLTLIRYRNYFTAENTEDTESENREMNNSDDERI
ncbi:MAG: hypothetical protein ACM65M_03155 [Microcoleus sp.]